MEVIRTPQLLIRPVNCIYAAIPSAAAVLGVAAAYGGRIFRSPAQQVHRMEMGEFEFHNGILLPHQKYLYGSSGTGEPYIIGKKLTGEDYSAWEAEYKNFPRLKSLTLEGSEGKSIYSWSFEGPKAPNAFAFWQLLLWLAIGILCVFLLRAITRKVMNKFLPAKYDKEQETLALPTSDIDVEFSVLTNLWRCTLIRLYREQKGEILSLSKLAVHYMNSNRNLRKSITKEKKNKGKAKSALATMKAEHADEVAALQRQVDDLKRMLDDKSNSAKEPEKTTSQETNEKAEDVAGSEDPVVEAVVGCSSTNSQTEGEHATSQETNDNIVVEAIAGCSSTDGPTEAENRTAQETIETIEDVTGSETPVVDPVMGGSSEQTRKPKIRANRRADGTIRTQSHPDYVPLEVSQAWQGDRPFNPTGRGTSWNRGPGGRGRGRGGDRGGPFGWRGGRNRGGRGGGNMHDGQPNRGRGQ